MAPRALRMGTIRIVLFLFTPWHLVHCEWEPFASYSFPLYAMAPRALRMGTIRIALGARLTPYDKDKKTPLPSELGYGVFCPYRMAYKLAWHVLDITSICCSFVKSMNFTAYPDTRIVKFAYSSFSGCSIASISFSVPNTFTFR